MGGPSGPMLLSQFAAIREESIGPEGPPSTAVHAPAGPPTVAGAPAEHSIRPPRTTGPPRPGC
ncbi:DUF6053 domain-containing protein [Lysobacter enzymogenes]|uniref:DUF6053 domain-containing protein n=1 Tax=Lysobacter enzymogenes TaxID=69 RepID=UPI00374A1CFB